MLAAPLIRLSILALAAMIGGVGIFVIGVSLSATGLFLHAFIPLGAAFALAFAGGAR